MKKFSVILIVAIMSMMVLSSGCDEGKQILSFFNLVSEKAPGIMEKAEPTIMTLEDATGKRIPVEVSNKGVKVGDKIYDMTVIAKPIVSTIGGIFPATKPVADTVNTVITGIGLFSLVASRFFRKRLSRSEKDKSIIMEKVDDLPGVGKAIMAGLDKESASSINDAYVKMKSEKEFDKVAVKIIGA